LALVETSEPDGQRSCEIRHSKTVLFVIDEDGKEHEMEIVKKVLREKPDKAKPPQE